MPACFRNRKHTDSLNAIPGDLARGESQRKARGWGTGFFIIEPSREWVPLARGTYRWRFAALPSRPRVFPPTVPDRFLSPDGPPRWVIEGGIFGQLPRTIEFVNSRMFNTRTNWVVVKELERATTGSTYLVQVVGWLQMEIQVQASTWGWGWRMTDKISSIPKVLPI